MCLSFTLLTRTNTMRILSTTLLLAASLTAGAQSITSTSQFTWSPDLLTVTAGTPITITVTGNHVMRQVSEDTWNNDQNTGVGGFEFSGGTHTLVLDEPGTYWYVCVPHVSSGMKGIIIVEGGNSVPETGTDSQFNVFPNPAKDQITVLSDRTRIAYTSILDVRGREVLRQDLHGMDRINVSTLVVGSYTLVLFNSKGEMQERQRLSITR